MSGKLVVFSGPSGSGKDTVLNAWMKKRPIVRRVVAYTTRQPREGEINGVDYHFVTESDFLKMAEMGAFLEHKCVHGNYYATPLHDMEMLLSEGLIAVLKIDAQGALAVMQLRPDALTVFLMPPSMEELEVRIRARHTETEEQLQVRLENAKWEISQSDKYDHRVVNDVVERAVDELDSIVLGAMR